jgi:hypothetical protein
VTEVVDFTRECVWCADRECWVHREICRSNAYAKGWSRCLACLQITLFPAEALTGEEGARTRKGARTRGEPKRKDPAQEARQLAFPFPGNEPENWES